ncbi:MAG: N-acetylmuramoyl-L-alanine amidase, partial [Acidobacteriota bacterium]|nr:N-acetylmuramoyl-L-alanine amidase [Acidobacteriota bacterium]
LLAVLGGMSRAPVERSPQVGSTSSRQSNVARSPAPGSVWMVEQHGQTSVYSNGLEVRNDFQTVGAARLFRPLTRAGLQPAEVHLKPVGIVFHTSESWMAPFEAPGNESLKRFGLGLLANARHNRLYNFVIDRFGRVYSIVPAMQAANHAGNSVWADSKFVYVNLNQSFIGISFEAQTGASSLSAVNDAQIHAGQVLTQMLRSVYGIAEADCVTHAQVSVNPAKMFIGYHTDWASSFPFREIGLSEGYANPIAGVSVFGFRYDNGFLQAIGGRPWQGLVSAEKQLIQEAAALGMTPDAYRGMLQKRYKDTIGGRENLAAAEEIQHEQS